MQFILIGRDGTDAGAMDRRMKARPGHIATCDRLQASGNMLYGAALLDDNDKMCGSVIFCEFPSRAELDAWLREEPYITGKVWASHEVSACRTGPSFEKTLERMKAK